MVDEPESNHTVPLTAAPAPIAKPPGAVGWAERAWVALAGGAGAMFGTSIYQGVLGIPRREGGFEGGFLTLGEEERRVTVGVILFVAFLFWKYFEPIMESIGHDHRVRSAESTAPAPVLTRWSQALLALIVVVVVHFLVELFSLTFRSSGMLGLKVLLANVSLYSLVTFFWTFGVRERNAARWGLIGGAVAAVAQFEVYRRAELITFNPWFFAFLMAIWLARGYFCGRAIDRPGSIAVGLRITGVNLAISIVVGIIIGLGLAVLHDPEAATFALFMTGLLMFQSVFWGSGIYAYLPSRKVFV